MKVTKLNESYSVLESSKDILDNIFEFLKVEVPGCWFDPLVKSGLKSPYQFFASRQNSALLVSNGHLDLLGNFGVVKYKHVSKYSSEEIDSFLLEVVKLLPFDPYDFQVTAFKESLLNGKQINRMCTSSGKSLTISLLAEFFRQKGLKGLLLVPNINLLTQFKSDISSYNLTDLHEDLHVIGGGSTERHFNNSLTISTWQSMMSYKDELDALDYVITDECHRFASEETSDIVRSTLNCEFKWGFTGTIPESPVAKMELFGLFGIPKTYITSRELIDRKLATPIIINAINLKYSNHDKSLFKSVGMYPKQLQFIKEHSTRTKFITSLSCKIKSSGNTLVLFQHTDHGKEIFCNIMDKLFPDVEVVNKNIVGKKSFDFQEQYGVYFINGEDDAKIREKTRQILEHHEDAILVANYAVLSTGVNIKKLHNMVLASPLKSYTTVTQSIGRLMRLHPSKQVANVYDIVDNIGIFKRQYTHRKNISYNSEEYPIKEVNYLLEPDI